MYKSSDSTIKCVRDFTVVIAVDPSPQAEYAVNCKYNYYNLKLYFKYYLYLNMFYMKI